MLLSLHLRVALIAGIAVVSIGGYWLFAEPMKQPLSYHNFADQRTLFSVPHALNVLSNFPFVLFGILGIAFMLSERSRRPGVFLDPVERWPYWTYFVGLLLTGIGSSYYHANPTNATLTWDRLPLAIMFMGLFTGILAERLHVACVRWLLVPLVLFGMASVFYWDYTERLGAGDLRFYFTVQFFPMLALPILLIFCPPRYTGTGDLVASLILYVLAKVLELMDEKVYTGAGFVSGHTLKHLVSGVGSGFILLMLWRRRGL